jgi:ribosomal protein L3 glutamine methyltransferase
MEEITSDYNFVSEDVIQAEINQELSTVGDMLRYLTTAISKSGVYCGHGSESPYQEAAQLLSFALGLDYEELDGFKSSYVTARERRDIFEFVRTRIFERVPTPYITNISYFAGLKFYVDERVLIPRSPIAELIESRFEPYLPQEPSLILDLCTGSGCLAIAAAAKLGVEVDAVDISDDALDVCSYNVDLYNMNDLVFPIKSDLFSSLDDGVMYDLIISNPPYVDDYDMDNLPDEFLREPPLALAAGEDGLDVVRRILADACDYLKPDGYLICEVGNSMDALCEQYPEVDFEWIDLKNGGSGVFAISCEELKKSRKFFKEM